MGRVLQTIPLQCNIVFQICVKDDFNGMLHGGDGGSK